VCCQDRKILGISGREFLPLHAAPEKIAAGLSLSTLVQEIERAMNRGDFDGGIVARAEDGLT
jgi:hypothetical protein